MEDEQIYHLIDLLEMNITATLMSCHGGRNQLSIEQKADSVRFDRDLIIKLKKKTKGK